MDGLLWLTVLTLLNKVRYILARPGDYLFISGRTGVGVIVNNGFALTDDVQKADAFNHYFASVGIVDDGLHPNCVDVPLRKYT